MVAATGAALWGFEVLNLAAAGRVDQRTVMSLAWLLAVACLGPPLVAQSCGVVIQHHDCRPRYLRGQAEDGRFVAWAGESGADQDLRRTALAALALVGSGSTLTSGPYRAELNAATRWLVSRIDARGRFVDPACDHDHATDAVATWALVEIYGASDRPASLRKAVVRASSNLLREPLVERLFGKRDAPHEDVLRAWVLGAYKACQDLDVNKDKLPWDRVRGWADRLARPAAGFHDTVAMLAWIYSCGAGTDIPRLRARASAIVESDRQRAASHRALDFEQSFHTALALFQLGGEHWNVWRPTLEREVLRAQRTGDEHTGTWDPPPALAGQADRLLLTFLGTLNLEIYYRYSRFVR